MLKSPAQVPNTIHEGREDKKEITDHSATNFPRVSRLRNQLVSAFDGWRFGQRADVNILFLGFELHGQVVVN